MSGPFRDLTVIGDKFFYHDIELIYLNGSSRKFVAAGYDEKNKKVILQRNHYSGRHTDSFVFFYPVPKELFDRFLTVTGGMCEGDAKDEFVCREFMKYQFRESHQTDNIDPRDRPGRWKELYG